MTLQHGRVEVQPTPLGGPWKRGEEFGRLCFEIVEDGSERRLDEQRPSFGLGGTRGVSMKPLRARPGHLNTKEERGGVFDLMCLIKDDGLVVRNDAGAGPPESHREIREEEMMVDDDELAFFRAPPHPGDITIFVKRAARSDPRLGAARDVSPDGIVFGKLAKLGAVTRLRLTHEALDERELFFDGRLFRARALEKLIGSAQAEIVGQPLHHGGADGSAERTFEQRKIFFEDLILKVPCACRDDDAIARKERGKEVGHRLARSRPRLDDEFSAANEHIMYRFGHRDLALAMLVSLEQLGKAPVGSEKIFDDRAQGKRG